MRGEESSASPPPKLINYQAYSFEILRSALPSTNNNKNDPTMDPLIENPSEQKPSDWNKFTNNK